MRVLKGEEGFRPGWIQGSQVSYQIYLYLFLKILSELCMLSSAFLC